jgi:hypothetical protein
VLDGVINEKYNGLEVGVLSKSLIEPSETALLAVPVLKVTCFCAGGILSSYVLDIVLGLGKNNRLEVGVLSKSLIKPSETAVLAVPVLEVTHIKAGGILSSYVLDIVLGSGKDYGLEVGVETASLVKPCAATNGAVPVLEVTHIKAGRSESCYVLDGVVNNADNSLNVSVESLSLVKPCVAAGLAVPVLKVTCFCAGCFLSSNVLDVVACGRNDYRHFVEGHAGSVFVIPATVTMLAVPVLDVTVLVAVSFLSLSMLDAVSSLGIGKLATVYAVLIANEEILVISLSRAGQTAILADTVLAGSGIAYALAINVNAHHIGELGESFIGPYCVAVLAVPVFNVTEFYAGNGSLSILVLDGVSSVGIGLLAAVHTVCVARELICMICFGSGLSTALRAVLSTFVLVFVRGIKLFHAHPAKTAYAGIVNCVLAGSGELLSAAIYALAVNGTGSVRVVFAVVNLFKLFAAVNALTRLAERSEGIIIFVVAVGVTFAIYFSTAFNAGSILTSGNVTTVADAFAVGILAAKSTGNYCTVGSISGTYVFSTIVHKSRVGLVVTAHSVVLKVTAAVSADPVLVITGLQAVCGNLCLNLVTKIVGSIAELTAYVTIEITVIVVCMSSGNDYHHSVKGHAGSVFVVPASAAVLTSPVLNVTVLGAGSSNSLNVIHAVSSLGIGKLAALHAVSVASVEVLVLACRSRIGDGYGSVCSPFALESVGAVRVLKQLELYNAGLKSLELDGYNIFSAVIHLGIVSPNHADDAAVVSFFLSRNGSSGKLRSHIHLFNVVIVGVRQFSVCLSRNTGCFKQFGIEL